MTPPRAAHATRRGRMMERLNWPLSSSCSDAVASIIIHSSAPAGEGARSHSSVIRSGVVRRPFCLLRVGQLHASINSGWGRGFSGDSCISSGGKTGGLIWFKPSVLNRYCQVASNNHNCFKHFSKVSCTQACHKKNQPLLCDTLQLLHQ